MNSIITDYHAKLFATELLIRHPSDSIERFAATLMDSRVDLNPHQIDAALFAFRSPFSKGAILADEVGLGKTIEAGIVLAQKWAEQKRKILIILPSSLRKQWHQELFDKFYLPSQILESASFNTAHKSGVKNPFEVKEIVICSYQFARNKADYIKKIQWDLVVLDEAHRLRNVYKTGNKIAREIKATLEHAPKLLLTATPLQNSLLELFGLVSFIDEHTFGDFKSFRSQFARLTPGESFDDLKHRLKPICKRTLRRQVLEYIRYTERRAYTQEFFPTPDEEVLYDMVSEYLRKETLHALPSGQRNLMTLVLRKLLASSTFAIAGALEGLANKLERKLKELSPQSKEENNLEEDFETYAELADELEEEGQEAEAPLTASERASLEAEIKELRSFFEIAMQITENAKGEALLQALKVGFQMTRDLGGAEKAIIFTESRRTQNYLVKLLEKEGYGNEIVLFNGSNTDAHSSKIYTDWKEKYLGTDQLTGSRSADTRAALVDYFRHSAKIMIATEAAAEGINLQFCSLVVNYDLPWNPQRIEQRIGRCHRYGQSHDVVVVNFLNKSNAADQRVYQLLSEKFNLFNGVFGASDEVLGSIESGVDFEKRIVEIYQKCRTTSEIQASFDALQQELSVEIDENMRRTRQQLLENFDVEVAEKLHVYQEATQQSLGRYETRLWELTRHILRHVAEFDEHDLLFTLSQAPVTTIERGLYALNAQTPRAHHYRLHHPLAAWVIQQALAPALPLQKLVFQYRESKRKISVLEPLLGQSGFLRVSKLTIESLETEDHLIFTACNAAGSPLEDEQAQRLFNLPAMIQTFSDKNIPPLLASLYQQRKQALLGEVMERNANFFEEEMDKLHRWADDKRQTLKVQLKEFDETIDELKKQARRAPNLPDKLEIQKKLRDIEKKRDEAWKEYDEASKQVEHQKDRLIDDIESRLQQTAQETVLFTIAWELT